VSPPYILPYLFTYLLTHLLTYLITYSMVQSPSWEADWFAASQEILRISRNPKVHYRIHKCQPPFHIFASSIQSVPPSLHLPSSTVKPPQDAAWDATLAKLWAEHWTTAFRSSSKTNTLYNKRFTSRTSFRLPHVT